MKTKPLETRAVFFPRQEFFKSFLIFIHRWDEIDQASAEDCDDVASCLGNALASQQTS